MSKRVILVGHCSPDSSYLSIAIKSVLPDATVERAVDDSSVAAAIDRKPDLLLVNRVLDGDYQSTDGLEFIRQCRQSHPEIPVMLVSNYADAQAKATALGALPGFGKSELTSRRTLEVLASALGGSKL